MTKADEFTGLQNVLDQTT